MKQYLHFGGSDINNINNITENILLCGTHNNRLVCYFKKIVKNFPKKHFNNCAIIKCYKINNKVKFRMIYDGEVYNYCNIWTIKSFNKYFDNKYFNINLPDKTEIYLIRHALGYHNIMSLFNKIFCPKKDSQLTINGIEQAEKAGLFLKGYFKNFYSNPKLYFLASTLIRTRQTIGIIMKMLNIIDSIYVIPCINELVYVSNCNCDTHIFQNIPIASNIPLCTNNKNSCDILTQFSNLERYKCYKVQVNWDYYNNIKCKNTNILFQIIHFYNNLKK